MNRITLVVIAAFAAPLAASAQAKPESPRPPRPESARPIFPAVPPMPAMPAMPARPMVPDFPDLLDVPEFSELQFQLDAMNAGDMDLHMRDMDLMTHDLAMQSHDMGRQASQLLAQLDVQELANRAHDMADWVQHDQMPYQWFFQSQDEIFLRSSPRPAWAHDDPADSLYRVAREALNRGEYRRAAQLFNEITAKFPKSEYSQDCAYWEAFSRYRLGGTDDLKQALKILDGLDTGKIVRASRESSVDLPALRARVQGALAARGDKDSEARLKLEAAQNDGCDREEVSVRAEALSALGQMDMQAALPVVKKVLARRDDCTVELRRRALYLVGRQADSTAAAMILDVARNDTDAGIRGEAMRWLPRVAGDNAIPLLEELLRTSTDEQTQRSAVNALGVMDSDRARRAIRALIERTDVAERVRYEAVLSISREREGRQVSADDLAYLRSLYSKLETPRLREAVLMSLSRVDAPENQQFLLAVARNEREEPALRAAAMQRVGRMQGVTASDIAKLYDVADARSLREQILYALSQRKEPEAIDKMMDIARKDTDPQIRRTAISLLARSNNERAKKMLAQLIDQ